MPPFPRAPWRCHKTKPTLHISATTKPYTSLPIMWHVRFTRRHLRALSYTILLCLIIGFWTIISHERSRDHYLSRDLVGFSSSFEAGEQVLLSPNDIESTCRAHGFAPVKPQTSRRKIYDLVLMSTELDWLEIRLHTLSHCVDYFVIIESPTTFTGKPKPLHLRDNWDLFKDFHHKIIYRISMQLST